MIQLAFHGAAGEVTGSCYLLTTDRAKVLIDMGMHQGERESDGLNREALPFAAGELDAVVLTHAHLDHCGRLPLLAKAGYRGPVHCTAPTADLTGVILRDSAAIQEADADRFNRRLRRPNEAPATPLYSRADAEATLPLLAGIDYGVARTIADGIDITFFDAGHILGSASVRMTVRDAGRVRTIVFSGDIGVVGSPILRDPVTPPAPADVVLLESTYGDRDHRSLAATRDEFLGILQQADAVGGRVLIPAFAVGRTQDLVFHMGEFLRAGKIRQIPVYVDSPMAVAASKLYARHRQVYDDRARELLAADMAPLEFPGLTYTRTVEESKRINDTKGAAVVIAAGGMCNGGRILHHLLHGLPNPNTHVVIAGYQSQGTLGRRLVDGARRVAIFREDVPVRARVHTLGGFSAHAGQSGLLNWAAPFEHDQPRVFLTHGEERPRQALREKLRARFGMDAALPAQGEVAEL